MKFNLSFTWSYDPWGIIFKLTIENKTTPYIHTSRTKIEKYVNQWERAENTLREAEEKLFSTLNLQTPTPQAKTSKRQREEGSSSTTDSEAKDFWISYMKITNMTPRIDAEKEAEDQAVITINHFWKNISCSQSKLLSFLIPNKESCRWTSLRPIFHILRYQQITRAQCLNSEPKISIPLIKWRWINKQTGEMISSTLTSNTMSLSKL